MAAFSFSPAALAQTASTGKTAADEAGGKFEEVVVTARKQGESLLKVPIAVSAITAKDIQATGIANLTDISAYTPGFTLDNNGSDQVSRGVQSLFIRGMSSSVSPSVSVFIDGAPVPSGFVSDIADAARVEVLKGPQSAFFGRDTFGGAVNIVTKDPSAAPRASFDGLYGSDNWYDLKGSIEGTIIPDKLTARLSLRDYSTDGQYKSTIAPYSRLGAQSTKSISLALKFTPVDNLTIKTFAAYSHDSDGPAPVYKFNSSSYNCNAGAGGADNYICGTLPTLNTTKLPVQTAIDSLFYNQVFNNATKTLNPLFSDMTHDPGFVRNQFHAHINIDYYIPNLNLTLTSLTSGNILKSQTNVDLDDSDTSGIANFYTSYGISGVESFYRWYSRVQTYDADISQEFRATSDQNQRFRYTGGLNYSRSTSQTYVDGLFPYGTSNFGAGGPQVDEVEGVFGSLSLDLTSKLTLSFEGRYQHDSIRVYNRYIGAPDTTNASARSDDFLPRAIIQYKFTPSIMGYITYSKGVNPPVFNTALVGKPAAILAEFENLYDVGVAVKPEYLENYEAGVKGRFFDGRLQLSADGYFDKWTHQILSQFVSVPGIASYLSGAADAETVQANGGLTHLWGVEVDGQYQATDHLMFAFAGAWNKTEIESYPNYRCSGDACTADGGVTDIVGHALPNAPEYSANLSATYTGKVTDTLGWYGRADYIYKGSEYTDLSNLTKIGDSNRFNFRVGLTRDTLTAEIFVLNAFNDRAYTSATGTTDIDGQPNSNGAYPYAVIVGMPVLRQFGFRVKKTF